MADHDKTVATDIVVSAYYRVHPDYRQAFIDAVTPEMAAAQQMPGCVFYAETFLSALSSVVRTVRILDRQGMRYDVARMHLDDPRGRIG
ncbi:antibiotic biosynthesis monooxygenase [Mycolicibacterium chubuense]|uniref:ABM domain-containing protein n=1 Tax=Mycolicibacterium chubuense TaxID=1800 RepID=A0A0J6WCD1_MYCCU|nr:antibiotic biosynthesis monooxygenase [Mycolicibacterium chubuense]KMO80204.1 hypothetical protein MCHUDSM44219_02367 [Mycolicibacterium chubuense]ORA54723.1 antibiotic biosynthesis monooxygenase [Mycolicibacterium chubuense]SPY45559.1 Uncharacterised protein [Mycolicibacterium chubuense]